jgi:hypothetical protein
MEGLSKTKSIIFAWGWLAARQDGFGEKPNLRIYDLRSVLLSPSLPVRRQAIPTEEAECNVPSKGGVIYRDMLNQEATPK